VAWYVFRSMRTTYAQGRFMTGLKFVLIGFAYLVAATLMFLVTLVYSALTL
jgi:hypothetical protein